MHTQKRHANIALAALAALTLVGGTAPRATAQTLGSDYPYQARAGYTLDATINQVDTDRDRLVVTGDDGRAYTIDLYQTVIVLRGTTHAGQTADLVPGMRLHIVGTKAADDLVEADRVTVLPYPSARPTAPGGITARQYSGPMVIPAAPFTPGERVTLRGTVEAIDNRARAFTLRINDHTRRVFIDDTTDLRDLGDANDDPVPLHAGDRVSVVGNYQDNGSVLAAIVTPRRLDAAAPITGAPSSPLPDDRPVPPRPIPDAGRVFQGAHSLRGRISQESSFLSRDIKVRLNADEEVTVHVPKNIPIRRNGRAISVHDLHKGDIVRVTGSYSGDAYGADRIDLLSVSADGQ